MKLKLMKISMKEFIFIFSSINVFSGLLLGFVVTTVSLITPEQEGSNVGVWAVLFLPVLNGLLGIVIGAILTGIFNLIAPFFGGIELEFEQKPAAAAETK